MSLSKWQFPNSCISDIKQWRRFTITGCRFLKSEVFYSRNEITLIAILIQENLIQYYDCCMQERADSNYNIWNNEKQHYGLLCMMHLKPWSFKRTFKMSENCKISLDNLAHLIRWDGDSDLINLPLALLDCCCKIENLKLDFRYHPQEIITSYSIVFHIHYSIVFCRNFRH